VSQRSHRCLVLLLTILQIKKIERRCNRPKPAPSSVSSG
jgi:hypothetical protein